MTQQYKFDQLVFIGRMEPPTFAHIEIISRALSLSKTVTIVLGSSFSARNPANPWTWEERAQMIKSCFSLTKLTRINIVPIGDYEDDQHWAAEVQKIVPKMDNTKLIGFKKDSTSFYLDMFPQWMPMVDVGNINGINATDVRNRYFSNDPNYGNDLPDGVYIYLEKWKHAVAFQYVLDETNFIQDYKTKVKEFTPFFVTADSVVIQSGHVLLIQRKNCPGKGLWALPGGFVNPDERIFDAAIRELREETCLEISRGLLVGSFKREQKFDKPNRSLRARIITHAFLFELPHKPYLPTVKGMDDALKAKWIPIGEIHNMRDQFFEDHFQILTTMLGYVK